MNSGSSHATRNQTYARRIAIALLGARNGLFLGGRSGAVIPLDAKVVQVDVDASEIGHFRPFDVGITADCAETLRALIPPCVESRSMFPETLSAEMRPRTWYSRTRPETVRSIPAGPRLFTRPFRPIPIRLLLARST